MSKPTTSMATNSALLVSLHHKALRECASNNSVDAQIRAAAIAHSPVNIPEDVPAEENASPAVETTEYPVQGDPTLQHAGMTELEDQTMINQQPEHVDSPSGLPQNIAIGEGNASAESHWDTTNNMSESQEWVDVSVPRDLTETDTGITATSAAATQPQSWADEQADVPAATKVCFHNAQFLRYCVLMITPGYSSSC